MWSGTIGDHPGPASFGLVAQWLFTDRTGGVSVGEFDSLNLAGHVGDDASAVVSNRRVLAGLLGVAHEQLAVINADHGAVVHEVTGGLPGMLPSADALVTKARGVALVALAADCTPIVLADTENEVAGVIHCGWRGVVAGVIPAAIDGMRNLGAHPPAIRAVIGPSICRSCYPVGDECAGALNATLPGTATREPGGNWHADIPGAAAKILAAQGVSAHSISECTYANEQLFSHRRDRRTGRQSAAIVLKSVVK